jgi:phosphatidylglycerol:prolipoprotein diacylglycerol transferase
VLPVLIEVPELGLAIHSRGLMIVLAALFCYWVGPRWIEALEGIDRRKSRRALLPLLPVGFLGARLHYVLSHWDAYADRPLSALMLWGRGMHAGGAILLVVVALPFALRRPAVPLGKFADGFVPVLGISIAVARLGCFLRGCCVGMACEWPWCLRFPDDSSPYRSAIGLHAGTPLHPLQLYFVVAALLIAAGALWLRRHKTYDGQVGLVALFFYSVSAAAIEPFRADHAGRVYWGQLPQLEWIGLGMTACAAFALVWMGIVSRWHRGGRLRETVATKHHP